MSSSKTSILILALSLTCVAACSSAASPDDPVGVDTALLTVDADDDALACVLPAVGPHAKCDGTTVHKAAFQPIQPALSTGTDDRAKAEEICGKYLSSHGIPTGAGGGRCGACPNGSDGCKPTDFKLTSGFQRDPVTGHWTCGGTNAPSMEHKCTRCVINGVACADIADRADTDTATAADSRGD